MINDLSKIQGLCLESDKFIIIHPVFNTMVTCELCNQTGDDLSLREATHKNLGKKWVCGDCWTKLYDKNSMVAGTTDGGGSFSCPGGCAGCRNA